MDRKIRPVPALRINNRNANQTFLENDLGLTTRLEEGAFVECSSRQASQTQLILIESPSMRTRAVRGPKKLAKLVWKVEDASEIASLLARGSRYHQLYRGKRGYAFDAISPEGDVFLLHAEESLGDLQAIDELGELELAEGFKGLSQAELEQVVLRTDRLDEMQEFYQGLFPDQTVLAFEEATGPDLQAAADTTWDLDSLRFAVDADLDWQEVEGHLPAGYFKDKRERFIQTVDPSQIEVWFEK